MVSILISSDSGEVEFSVPRRLVGELEVLKPLLEMPGDRHVYHGDPAAFARVLKVLNTDPEDYVLPPGEEGEAIKEALDFYGWPVALIRALRTARQLRVKHRLIHLVITDPNPGDDFGDAANSLAVGTGFVEIGHPLCTYADELCVNVIPIWDNDIYDIDERLCEIDEDEYDRFKKVVHDHVAALETAVQRDVRGIESHEGIIAGAEPLTFVTDSRSKKSCDKFARALISKGEVWMVNWTKTFLLGTHPASESKVTYVIPAPFGRY